MSRGKKQIGAPTISYEDFFRSLSLVGLAVSEASFQVNREAYFAEESHQQVFEVNAEIADVGDKFFDVSVRLALKAGLENEKPVLVIKVTHLMHIHTKLDIDRQYLERFAGAEVRLIIWPYLREFVTSACSKMYVPPIFLPLPGEENKSGGESGKERE